MRNRWIIPTGMFALLVIIVYAVSSALISPSFKTKEFPLSEKWATILQGNIQQITIIDRNVIIARTLSKTCSLDVQSGNILWQQNTAWHFSYQPVLARNGKLFLTDGKGLMALNQSNGNILWQQDLRHPSSAEVVGGTQDLIAVNDPPYLAMYQAIDGTLLWEKPVCRERATAYFQDANIIVPCFGLTAIDAISGEIVWELKSDDGLDRIWKSAFSDGVIYYSQDLKNITAFDFRNRNQVWKTPLVNDRSQAFNIVEDHLLVTKDDQLCVLHRDDGKIVWCANDLIKAKNPVIYGDILYLLNGLQNGITAYDVQDGKQIGRLYFSIYNFITVENDKQLMVPADDSLIFGSGKTIFAYGK